MGRSIFRELQACVVSAELEYQLALTESLRCVFGLGGQVQVASGGRVRERGLLVEECVALGLVAAGEHRFGMLL